MSDRALLEDIIAASGSAHLETMQMFGVPCIRRTGGKPVISDFHGDLVFKLGAERCQQILATHPECAPFDPSGKGRPFKDWVQVPESAGLDWDALALEALERS